MIYQLYQYRHTVHLMVMTESVTGFSMHGTNIKSFLKYCLPHFFAAVHSCIIVNNR